MNRLWLLLLVGCTGDLDSEGSEDVPSAGSMVMMTVANGYDVAAVSFIDGESGALIDGIVSAYPDSVVQVDGEDIWVIERLGADVLRRYDVEDWTRPLVEFSAGAGTNPQGFARCGGGLFTTLYERAELPVYDPESGVTLGVVDLSPWADDDGLPEAASVLEVNGSVIVGLQQLDRTQGWVPSGPGRILQLDCDSREVVAEYEVGTNPIVTKGSTESELLIVSGEGIQQLDLSTGVLATVVPARETGEWTEAVATADHWVGITRDGAEHAVVCIDRATGETTVGWSGAQYAVGLGRQGATRAWVALRQGWEDPSSLGGLAPLDVETCAMGEWILPQFPPYNMAYYP